MIHATSVRDFIKEVQQELRPGEDLPPARAREVLGALTALVGNIQEEIRAADLAYANVYLAHLESSQKANHAKIRSETSPEFQRKREAHDTFKFADELITSLRCIIRSQEAEMRFS